MVSPGTCFLSGCPRRWFIPAASSCNNQPRRALFHACGPFVYDWSRHVRAGGRFRRVLCLYDDRPRRALIKGCVPLNMIGRGISAYNVGAVASSQDDRPRCALVHGCVSGDIMSRGISVCMGRVLVDNRPRHALVRDFVALHIIGRRMPS